MNYPLYRFLRPIITFLMHFLFKIEYVNQDYIPKKGPFILAGNHKSNFDCVALIASCSNTIRFLAKKELLDGKLAFLFRKMGIIPVNRKEKNKKAILTANEVLENNGVVAIFPEGTFNNTEYIMKPFKMGTVKIASDTNSPIIPFAIVGQYRLFCKNVKIIFGKPYYVDNKDLKGENIGLMNKVIMLIKNKDNI